MFIPLEMFFVIPQMCDRLHRHLPENLGHSLRMGRTATTSGYTSHGLGNGRRSGSTVSRNVRPKKDTSRPPDPSQLPEHRLRQVKSHTFRRKRHDAITDKLPRSCSAKVEFLTETSSMVSLSPNSLQKWDKGPVRCFVR